MHKQPHDTHEIVIATTLWLMPTKAARRAKRCACCTRCKAANSPPANGSPARLSPPPLKERNSMQTSHPASLLVAALVMLRHPCSRNKATARLLLDRAAEHVALSSAEREACRNLADDLDIERPEPVVVRTPRPAVLRPGLHLVPGRSRRLSPVPGLSSPHDMKGVPA